MPTERRSSSNSPSFPKKYSHAVTCSGSGSGGRGVVGAWAGGSGAALSGARPPLPSGSSAGAAHVLGRTRRCEIEGPLVGVKPTNARTRAAASVKWQRRFRGSMDVDVSPPSVIQHARDH